jgi:hypothetical protein
MLEEIKELKAKIEELERKALFVQDYDLITTLLKKLNVDNIEISKEEMMNTHTTYIVERKEDKYIIKEEGV